jgi:tetratricopeptide (TPR) repeat protein
MSGWWVFLPDEAVPLMVAAVRADGLDTATGPAAGDTETLGRELLRMVLGTEDDEALAELGRDPASHGARERLTHQAFEVFESDPAAAAGAAAAIAAFYRRRADAGDVQALVDLGDFLYWDEPEATRAAYQEAIDAGDEHALIALGIVLSNVLGDEEAALAAYDRAAASDDPDLRAEAMYQIACAQHRDGTAAAAMFRRVIGTGHPEWAGLPQSFRAPKRRQRGAGSPT